MMTLLSRIARQQKLMKDISYSIGSFFVLGISGIVINIVITATRDAAALAVFNLAFAVYIVASQFAVWGIHYSVLRYTAYYQDETAERGRLLLTASFLVTILGLLVAAITAWFEPIFAWVFHNEVTGRAIFNASWGLIFFPLNKVLLAYVNGLRKIKAFSVLQGLRYLIIMIVVSLVSSMKSIPIESSTYAFLASEFLTACLACWYLLYYQLALSLRLSRIWLLKHFKFGTKSLLAGMFTEINTRVDVLIIGLFLTDRLTGIYSFAAMLVEGLYQILAMIRINFNPLLVSIIRDSTWEQAKHLRVMSRHYILPAFVALSLLLIAAYYTLATFIIPDKGLMEGMSSMIILLTGLSLVAMYVPFDNLLVISGHPGYQAIQQCVMVCSNVVAAVLLVPILGINGAAIGTVMSYLSGIMIMLFLTQRLLNWNLILNKVGF